VRRFRGTRHPHPIPSYSGPVFYSLGADICIARSRVNGGISVLLKYLGHASVKIDDLIVDPWTDEMPGMGLKNSHVFTAADRKTNLICISHDHLDHHLGAEALAKENDATVVTGFELAVQYAAKGTKVEMMNVGGQISVKDWSIFMTKAFHSASSNPSGFILRKNGKTVYHAGDTSFFSGMKNLGERFSIDVAFLPIGDRFTMGIEEAVHAAQALSPKLVIPIHFNTFPMINADENDFKSRLEKLGIACKPLKPGQEIEI